MNPAKTFQTLTLLFCTVLLVLLISVPAAAQEESKVADELSRAIKFYSDLEFDEGLAITRGLLDSGELSSRDSIAVYAVESMLTFGKGKEYENKSYDLLQKMAEIGPCTLHLPYEFWPKQLRDEWFKIAKAKNSLVCPSDAEKDITTIAIMEFDNYSIGKYQEELGFITKGLAEFFESDFGKISDLRVVERDKINFILDELKLSEEGKVDQATAVRVGKLLGAQLMIFGSITQLDDRNTKMLVKVVKVETSEIIASVDREGRPEYFKMEKELVKDLAGKLDLALNAKETEMLKESGTENYDAATLYSKGLYFMDRYDYKQAYEFFKLAYDADQTFDEARRKMEIYRPLAAS